MLEEDDKATQISDLARLEIAKLEREVAEFDKPLYRRPAFWGVIGPTTLAAATLGLGVITGLFNVERKLLENETTLLKIERANLEKDKETAENALALAEEDLRIRQQAIEEELRLARDNLARQEAALAAQLETERQRNADAIEQLELSTKGERTRLEGELEDLRTRTDVALAELKNVETDLLLAPVRADLEALRLTDQAIWQLEAMERLIQKAANDPSIVALVEETLAATEDPTFSVGLYYLLHQANPSEENLERVFDFVRKNSSTNKVWQVFGGGYWNSEVQARVLSKAFDFAAEGTMSSDAFLWFSPIFHLYKIPDGELRQALRSNAALPFLETALDAIQKENVWPTRLTYAATIFSVIDHDVGSIVIANFFKRLDESERLEFRLKVEEDVLGDQNQHFTAALTTTGLLDAIRDNDVNTWLSETAAPELLDTLSSGDIAAAIALTAEP